MWRKWAVLVLLPGLLGFDASRGREALDLAFHNLYGSSLLAAVELVIEGDGRATEYVAFAYGRKRRGDETRTLLYTADRGRESPRALLFQRPGDRDRMFVSEGMRGQVRAMSTGRHDWPLFGSDFAYADFRVHTSEDYRIEVLGSDRIEGEPTLVLRLRPLDGPYHMLLAWLSTERPVILRVDYFDAQGLWKRYRARRERIRPHFEWWVPMEDRMLDLRTGRHTTRRIRNILVDVEVPDEMFTLPQLSRGLMPTF